jgi:predicted Zn-dependent protease
MPVLRTFAIAVLFFSDTLAVNAQSQAQIEKSERGRELMAEGKFEEAIPVYRQLSQAVPNNPGLLLNLGMALQMAGHSRQAIPPLENAIKLDAGIRPAWLFLGDAYLGTGDPARAVRPLERYVKLQPDDPNGHQSLGDALLATERFPEAAAEYRKLSELDANNPRAWYGLNRSYTALAQSAFQAVEKAAPESAWWLALVADERAVRRQFRSAFFFYRKAQALQPGLRGLHTSIANVYKETGHADWAEAEQRKEPPLGTGCAEQPLACEFFSRHYDEGIRRADQLRTPEAFYWQSRAYAELARQALARLEQLPEGADIHDLRAGLMRARRQNQEALKEWRLALKYAPNDSHLREELLSSLYQARDYPAALALLQELLREDPASAQLNFIKGDILLSSQETEKAIPYLKLALKADPKLVAAHHALGRAYMQVGQPVAAIPHLQAAVPIDDDGSLRYQLAKAYQATGQTELGKKTLAEYQERQKADREEKRKLEEELQITPP